MINFKKSFFPAICLLVTALLIGCSSDTDDVPAVATEIKTSADANGLTFAKSGGSKVLSIQADGEVVVTPSETWCSVEEIPSTSVKIVKYNVTLGGNPETNDREAIITISSGTLRKQVKVIQTAADGLLVTTPSFDAKAEGETITVKYTTNGEPEVAIDVDWIKKMVNARAVMQDKTLQFEVKTNYRAEPRVGKITFTLNELTETVTVSQAPMNYEGTGMESDAVTLISKMYAGINIGNTMEACNNVDKVADETMWGNPMVNDTYIKGVKAAGFNAVRIPCAWDYYIEDQTTYKLKESWLNRVDEVVGYCVANDLYAIVNIHWDGGWLENNCTPDKKEENVKKQAALWTQIANKLNHYDEHVLFAGCNEPNVENATQMEVLKAYEQAFVDAVRATGGNNAIRNLIVQGPSTDINKSIDLFTMPYDVIENRLVMEVHYYDPFQFTIMDADESWGKVHYFWGDYLVPGSDRNSDWADEAYVKAQFQKMKTKFVDKGIPVILGEYGVSMRNAGANQEAHDKSRQQWYEVVTREAKNHGVAPFLWDVGGLINRNNGELKDHYAMEGVMKGAAEGKYPY